jgi:hypothetical protein
MADPFKVMEREGLHSEHAALCYVEAKRRTKSKLMNEIKAEGVKLGELVAKLRATDGLDQRWVSIGATDLQTGLMALTRGVAQPTTF